jgi:dTDP-4-amino-4,6-dideoxygalactose transaminase
MSELQAAMGLAVLPNMPQILNDRKRIFDYYISNLEFDQINLPKYTYGTEWNYSYFPILFHDESNLLKVQAIFNKKEIFPRRYFHPSLNTLPYNRGEKMHYSESISDRILCLPMYHSLSTEELQQIVSIINSFSDLSIE